MVGGIGLREKITTEFYSVGVGLPSELGFEPVEVSGCDCLLYIILCIAGYTPIFNNNL